MEFEETVCKDNDTANDTEILDFWAEREKWQQEEIQKHAKINEKIIERHRKEKEGKLQVWDSVTAEKMSLKKYGRIYGPYLRQKRLEAENNSDGMLTEEDFKLARKVFTGALEPDDFDSSGLKNEKKIVPLKKTKKSHAKKSFPALTKPTGPFDVCNKPRCLTKSEAPSVRRERQPGDDYFLTTERGLMRNAAYRKLFKGPGTVYEFLWQNIVRAKMVKDKFHIKENYDDKGLMAFSTSYRYIAKKCFMDKDYVKKVIKDFEEAGIIRIETVIPEGGKRPQNVYILGTWEKINGKRVEHLYRDALFLTEKNM